MNQLRPPILQIIPRLDAGGAERTTIDIAAALVAAGHPALVVSEGGRFESELRATGATIFRLPTASKNPLTIFRNVGRLARIIRAHQVALVHARSRAPAWSAYYAAKRAHIPFVTTHHGTYGAKNALKRFYNSVMVRGDAVIANSQWTAEHLGTVHSVAPKRVVVIPRGIDLDKFDPERVSADRVRSLRADWGVGDGGRVVLLPGRLTRWKGQLVLIDALARLSRSASLPADLRVVLAGDSQGRRAYVEEVSVAIADAGLGKYMKLVGHIREMAPAYLAADIVVSASFEPESFGRIPVEAAAMERPVIATDHGGARETVVPGESGLLVPPGDAAALADALSSLLALPETKLRAMGAKGRAHVANRYSVENMCTKTLSLYAELIEEARKS